MCNSDTLTETAVCQECGRIVDADRAEWTTVARTGRPGNVCDECRTTDTTDTNHASEAAVVPGPVFSITTHNGTVTAHNPSTGNHRTFRIRTQAKDARFAPGERVVSMLISPDVYQSFGFVTADGRIVVWRKHQGTQLERYARMLMHPEREAARFGIVFTWSARCRVCNRELTNPESLASGIGPVCEGRE